MTDAALVALVALALAALALVALALAASAAAASAAAACVRDTSWAAAARTRARSQRWLEEWYVERSSASVVAARIS